MSEEEKEETVRVVFVTPTASTCGVLASLPLKTPSQHHQGCVPVTRGIPRLLQSRSGTRAEWAEQRGLGVPENGFQCFRREAGLLSGHGWTPHRGANAKSV